MAYYYPPEEPDENTALMDIADLTEGVVDDPLPQYAWVEFLNLQENQMFDKVQSRKGGKARQVLSNSVIHMRAVYTISNLCEIEAFVKREEEAARLMNDTMNPMQILKDKNVKMNLTENFDPNYGPAPIPEIINGRECSTFRFFVDLEKIYTDSKLYPMFKLAKTDTVARNRFKLQIRLHFVDGVLPEMFESPVFRCRTKKVDEPASSPQKPTIPSPPPTPEATPPEAVIHSSVVTESLYARTARIDDLVFCSMSNCDQMQLSTPNADIAYHLKFKDDEIGRELQEGDVVGFFTDEDGGTYVKLLQSGDAHKAIHAGVISRSWYLAANRMAQQDSKTDTVCVIGMVNVKVIGSIENGERVYASIDRPGKAIPQSHLPIGSFLRKQHTLLGMAMEQKSSKSLEEEHLVRCFVCVVLDVGRQDILREVEEIFESSEKSTHDQIKFASKRAWRKLCCCFGSTFIFFVLLAFLLYQVFVPGSMFRYWLCRRGSISGDLWVTVTPYSAITERIRVHGIRFNFKDLKEKVSDSFSRNHKAGEGVRYYLNLDRCAYFGDKGPVRDYSKGTFKQIGGGKILSSNRTCSTVYWFGRHPNPNYTGIHWYPYVSRRDLRCSP